MSTALAIETSRSDRARKNSFTACWLADFVLDMLTLLHSSDLVECRQMCLNGRKPSNAICDAKHSEKFSPSAKAVILAVL
jgi:hypothetical protein